MMRLLRRFFRTSEAGRRKGLKAYQLLHRIAGAINARKCFLLTATTTGRKLLDGISISKFEMLVSVKYSPELDIQNATAAYQNIFGAIADLRREDGFDISFVDPYHSYEESCLAIEESISCLSDHGWMVLHDCYPPYELTADSYQEGAWCGSTYAAFRDVAVKGDRAWFVVDADFGLGVLGPKSSAGVVDDEIDAALASAWKNSDLSEKRELLKTNGRELMRVVSTDRVAAVLDRLLDNRPFMLDEFR